MIFIFHTKWSLVVHFPFGQLLRTCRAIQASRFSDWEGHCAEWMDASIPENIQFHLFAHMIRTAYDYTMCTRPHVDLPD